MSENATIETGLLTALRPTDFSHRLGGSLDENVAALLPKMTDNNTGSSELRHELK